MSMESQCIPQLVAAIRIQYEKVKELAAFASLKQSEFRPGDHMSLVGFMEAEEQHRVESCILDGHAQLLETLVVEQNFRFDADTRRLIDAVRRNSFL
ncbi:MAG: hypothetical protein WCS52_05680 [bacterium]|jgi:hypothetical protein